MTEAPGKAAQMTVRNPCRYCATDDDMRDYCSHTPAEVALSEAIAKAIHERQPTADEVTFILEAEDASNVIGCLGERREWVVEIERATVATRLVVNGVAFAIDPNEEGSGIARPQPPDFTCLACGESYAKVTESGCHVMEWSPAGVTVECHECGEVQFVPAWWPAESEGEQVTDDA